MGDSNKFQILIYKRHNDNKGSTTPNFCEMIGKGWTKFFSRNLVGTNYFGRQS
jgi:hypothetical protein